MPRESVAGLDRGTVTAFATNSNPAWKLRQKIVEGDVRTLRAMELQALPGPELVGLLFKPGCRGHEDRAVICKGNLGDAGPNAQLVEALKECEVDMLLVPERVIDVACSGDYPNTAKSDPVIKTLESVAKAARCVIACVVTGAPAVDVPLPPAVTGEDVVPGVLKRGSVAQIKAADAYSLVRAVTSAGGGPSNLGPTTGGGVVTAGSEGRYTRRLQVVTHAAISQRQREDRFDAGRTHVPLQEWLRLYVQSSPGTVLLVLDELTTQVGEHDLAMKLDLDQLAADLDVAVAVSA